MVDPVTMRRFLFRVQFLGVCLLLVFYKMLPLSTEPGRIPGPDLLFVFTAAVIMRRPNFAPVGLIVLVHLVADLLFMRPPGLWTALTLIAYEFLRNRRLRDSEVPVVAEIGLVVGVFLATVIGYTLVLTIFAVSHPGVLTLAIHVLTTAVCYPFAILVVHYILRVRRVKPGELDDDGAMA
jgi:rod shape-determining protein MreD